jgi:hypothetical protein
MREHFPEAGAQSRAAESNGAVPQGCGAQHPLRGGRREENRPRKAVRRDDHTDISKALHLLMKRSIRYIMESSGEPVSKYRDQVNLPGRPESILFSGAPTCWDTAHLFSSSSYEGGRLRCSEPQGTILMSFPMFSRSNCSRTKPGADCPEGRFFTPTL